MSTDQPGGRENFLNRWSRVKTQSRDAAPLPPTDASGPAEAKPTAAPADAASPPPELPPVDELTLESDFSGFFHPKVDEDVRRAALRKLFSDPHFNVMDGLDVYIDDYSKTEPIPAAMLASLKQAQRIFAWAAEKEEDAPGEGAPAAAQPISGLEAPAEPAALAEGDAQSALPAKADADPVPKEA